MGGIALGRDAKLLYSGPKVRERVTALLEAQPQDRVRSAIGVAFVHALIGYGLLYGLGASIPIEVVNPLKVFDVTEPPPPPPAVAEPLKAETKDPELPPKKAAKDPEGAAAPPNIKSQPTEIVAPPPKIVIPVPPPVVVAPKAGTGNAPTAGAAPRPGPGTGAGGQGTGTGSGRWGFGGGGGGGALAQPARWISGRIRDSDYPRSALEQGISGIVYLRFTVTTEGRVRNCAVTRSSGSSALDTTTCRLLEQRLRYRPARDEYGRPVPETITGEHVWETF